jgi:hypothetical protein
MMGSDTTSHDLVTVGAALVPPHCGSSLSWEAALAGGARERSRSGSPQDLRRPLRPDNLDIYIWFVLFHSFPPSQPQLCTSRRHPRCTVSTLYSSASA